MASRSLYRSNLAFGNNELSINEQVIPNRFYVSVVKLPRLLWRNSQNTDFDPKIKSIGFPQKALVVLDLYAVYNAKNTD